MKIASLLPAATEMACALGLEENLVGISFECDYPTTITHLPRLVHTALDTHAMTPAQIDTAVTQRIRSGQSLYAIDEALLKSTRPDIILTQDLCQVCAPSGNELSQALKTLDYTPHIIFMSPHALSDVEANLLELAQATATEANAQALLENWHIRINAVKQRSSARAHPRVSVLEWVEPIFCAGHWLAEMIEIAGGNDRHARKAADSVRISFEDIEAWQPEIIIVAPCGYNETQAQAQIQFLEKHSGWGNLPAVKNNRVHAVDANAYLVRPGPRLIEGIEMLENLFS